MNSGGPLLLAAFALALALASAWRFRRVSMMLTLAACGAALIAAAGVLASGLTWEWRSNVLVGGEPLHLRLDAVSAFFLALLAVLAGAATVYAQEYWPDADHPRSAPVGRVYWNALIAFMGLVLLSANGLHFLISWELFAISAFFLITLDRRQREVRSAGWLYLAASHAGTLCLFAFFALWASRTGSWELGPMRDRQDLAPLFWLVLLGFGLKAGIFPLHIWLPSAHANAPTHVSAILSGVAIKMGIYGLVRFTGWLPVPREAGWVIATLGIVSAVLGVAFALGQHDLKRLLAYHSVENIGIILIGLGFALLASTHSTAAARNWGRLALGGGLLHVWNHGLFKALLFLGAGSVLHATGTREMSRLGGLWRTMPWTASCFTLGAAAIVGLPPLNGFVSEWLLYLGLFGAAGSRTSAGWFAVPAAVLLGMTGAMALACFVKVCGIIFLGLPRTQSASRVHESGWFMRVPMLLLAATCVLIGLAPYLFWPTIERVSAAWTGEPVALDQPTPIGMLGICNVVFALLAGFVALMLWRRVKFNGVKREVTWDCGYAAPSPRMQYTAGSFAGIITEWFNWILRPERHGQSVTGIFPSGSSRSDHTPETVLEKVIEPLGHFVMLLSTATRRLQHGRAQAYILYLVLGLAALALLVFWGGHR